MLRRAAVMFVTVALLVGAGWVGQAICEENAAPAVAPAAAPGAPGGRDPAQMQQRMEQFRQQMSDRQKQAFGVTDEEWKVLQPKIEKVQTLARQSRGGGMGFMGGRGRGGPGGSTRGGPPSDRPQSEVEKKAEALQKVLENKEAKAEEIKAALTGLREARAAAKKELEAAQKELREVLTVRQEAQCVEMGILE
ncbi:MAG: hypothetical protein NTY65_14305 [Planctomycetota bacterium]|nr:hypothetical protein [Planctomycetota bacterium]